ncbi:hypothetical protein [Pedobacter endophyticus]|uniref:Uncharacterized protein n=1 Tax=Pedobacter endophyticus TaxID=2789740 RepID=A0A7S9L0D1_9SPHI|nr:hypothetical protein [Pedobacter endophyticus]QPH40170.1 hypothetical protein IZT61_02500 [Pedobacter endophyticus]
MNGVSPWALSASTELAAIDEALYEFSVNNFCFKLYNTHDSVWIVALTSTGSQICFRAVFSPGAFLEITKISERTTGVDLKLASDIGNLQCTINVEPGDTPILRYTTSLQPEKDLFIPFWPKDILATGKSGRLTNDEGEIHASQWGTRSGFIYMTLPEANALSVLYLQNLTALNDYCEQTQTSLADTVGGNWPELGFSLPSAMQAPLPAGKRFVINDAIIALDEQIPQKESEMIRQYLNLLSKIYLLLPLPETKYQNWPEILRLSQKDLLDSPGCWTQVAGHQYFNAYVSDYQTPPEVMVQLAVLLPLVDYEEWSGKTLKVTKTIKDGLPAFYDEKLGTINRWLPASEDQLQMEEEQKKPGVMDSWYLHHPLLNLSRLALKGDKVCEELFLNSIKYAIKVAHHFNYEWPVFYKMDTLEVIKAETAEGQGGEKDVAGIYAHVMLQAWELTKEKRYLNEAEKSARTLKGKGFQVFYQANNTAFSAGALLRLYKITNKDIYLELSYMCLASIFRNTKLWDCNYGYGKNFPSFFALFPLNDAPYTAVYEEQEVFCAFHDYLMHADGVEVLPAVRLLIAEYIRQLVNRAKYYYPVMLPKEMLEEKPKVGEVDPKLWIALEDLQDGWLKSGTVGQEVYGAGNAFGILPRHYLPVPDEEFMVYVDYPTSNFTARKGSDIHFKVLGDERLTCRMMILKTGKTKLPEFSVRTQKSKELAPTNLKDGHLEYQLNGNQEVVIAWKH